MTKIFSRVLRTGAFLPIVAIVFALVGSQIVPSMAFAASTIYVNASATGTPDGSQANPYHTIQDAITAASAGDTITVASGTYSEHVTINKSVTIDGQTGATLSVADGSVSNGFTISANNVTIEGFKIVGPASTSYTTYAWGSNVTRGIVVGDSVTGFTITNNTIEDTRNDILINGHNSTGSITGNVIDNSKSGISIQYTDGSGITISGNSQGQYGNDWGVNLHLNGHLDSNGAIVGSNNPPLAASASASDQQALLALSAANSGLTVQDQGYTSSNRTAVVVSPSGTATAQGDPLGPISSIQSGVNAVVSGGVVTVKAGTYAEHVTISKTLTLNGAQSGVSGTTSTRVHDDATTESILPGDGSYVGSLIVTAPNVVIDGFDFGPATDGVSSGAIGVDLGASAGATVTNSIFEHNQRGVSLNGASNVTISNDLVSNNNSNPQNNAGIWGDNVNGITIENSELDGSSNTAINLASNSSNIVINADVFKNDGNAAVIWQDSNVTFSQNYAHGFNGSGLFVTGTAGVTISDNDFGSGSAFNAISISSASGQASSGVVITGNTISGFNHAVNVGATSAVSDVVEVHMNQLQGNTLGINAPASATTIVDATDNYWGSASGPNTTGSDGTSGAVDYGTTWCTDSSCTVASDATLTAPTGLTPADGTVTSDPSFDDTWTPVTGAVSYEYQVSYTTDGTNLGTIIYSDDSSASNYTITPTLVTRSNNGTPEGTYYWQVRAVNASGVAGPWSAINGITVDAMAPMVTVTPDASTTLHGMETFTITVTDPNLDPSKNKNIYVYLYNVDGAQKSSGATVDLSTGTGTFTVDTTKLDDGTAWLDVGQLQDAAGNMTAGDTYVKDFTVDNTGPVVTVTPAEGSTLSGTTEFTISLTDANAFDTTKNKSVYVYLYNVDGAQKSSGATVDLSTGTGTFTVDTTKLDDGTAWLDVGQVQDAVGNLSGTGDNYFKNYTVHNAPVVITPVATPSATTNVATDVTTSDATLNGKNGDVDAQDHTFWVSTAPFTAALPVPDGIYSTPSLGAVAANTAFTATLSSVTTSGVPSNLPAVTPNTTYYFVAWTEVNGTWYPGTMQSFTTADDTSTGGGTVDTTAPTVPVPTAPTDASTINTNDFMFTWDSSTDASPVTYEFQSSMNPAETGGVLTTDVWNSGTLTTNSIHSTGAADGTWYWQVRAIDSSGNTSDWSPINSVIIDTSSAQPATFGAPELMSPSDASTVTTSTFDFTWNAVAPTDAADTVTYEWESSLSDATNTDGSFVTRLADQTNLTATTLNSPGTPNGTYYWHVRAMDTTDGTSDWSKTQSVTVASVTAPTPPPTATQMSTELAENGSAEIDFQSQSDTQPVSYAIATQPGHGTLGQVEGNAVVYTPTPGYFGSDSFTFTANAGGQSSTPATVSIEVTEVIQPNHTPVATDQPNVAVTAGNSVGITLAATDADASDTLTYATSTSPTNGTLTGTGSALTYTPANGFTGTDSFQFVANDGKATSTAATVTITVNAAPVVTSNVSTRGITGGGGGSGQFIPSVTTSTQTTGPTQSTGSVLGASTYNFTVNLHVGSRGADVIALQQFLIAEGYSIPAGATGYFGIQTKTALAAYQAANGISPAVGYFGPITRAKVNLGVIQATPVTTGA
jgi:hypothetical protein